MEFDLSDGRFFNANFCLECEQGICEAIGVFKALRFGLLSLCESVKRDAIAGEK